MRKIIPLFLLASALSFSRLCLAQDFSKEMEGANYLAAYQAKQGRDALISKGVLALLLGAGGAIVGYKMRDRKKKPPNEKP